MSGPPIGDTKRRIVDFPVWKEGQVKVVIAIYERCDGVIQEVISREAKLKLLVLTHPEVLEQGKVAVEKRGSLHIGQDETAIVAGSRRRETVSDYELVVTEIAARVAK